MDVVANWLWQGGTVALALCAMLRGLRRAPAQFRYVACWAALLLVVVLPAIPMVPLDDAGAVPSFVVQGVVVIPERWWLSATVIGLMWIAWASVNATGLIRAFGAVRRARVCALAFPVDRQTRLPHWTHVRSAGRRAALVTSEAVPIAAVLVGRAPAIAIAPALLDRLEDEELERVLLHEWAHVQRRDDLALMLQRVVHVVMGWHPAIRWIERRIDLEREIACDEIAVALAGAPKSYAACLVKLAGLRQEVPALVAPAIRPGQSLRDRVIRIVARGELLSSARSRATTMATVAGLCTVCVAVSGLTVVDQAQGPLPLPTVETVGMASVAFRVMPAVLLDVDSAHLARARTPSGRSVEGPLLHATRAVAAQAPVIESAPEPETSEPDHRASSPPSDRSTVASADAAIMPDTAVQREKVPDAALASPPWDRTADVGADIGIAVSRRSRAAGIGTANAFRRFANRVAGSF